jgi:hypothetical protein
MAISDDYQFWHANGETMNHGKPLFIDQLDSDVL